MSANLLSRSRGASRLEARRRQSRRRALFALCALAVVLVGAAVWGVWQPAVRISRIDISGLPSTLAESAPLENSDIGQNNAATGQASMTKSFLTGLARAALTGTYLGVIPRDSIFFFPAEGIRARILAAAPELASLSIRRENLSGILLVAHPRVPLAEWCGVSYEPAASSTPSAPCSVFDAGGFVYASAGSTTPVLPFLLYAPLSGAATVPPGTIADASALSALFDFARQAGSHGSPVKVIVLRESDGEVDDYLVSGTRLTYVLGQEAEALTAFVSATQSAGLNLSDGSISYVDLRFPGKVYVKKVGSTQ